MRGSIAAIALSLAACGALALAVPAGAALLPDYRPARPADWADAVVASPLDNLSGSHAPAPTVLIGDQDSYFGYAAANGGTVPGGLILNRLHVADTPLHSEFVLMNPGVTEFWVGISGHVRGGRHTVWQALDTQDQVDESDETNNTHARQWVWQPQPLVFGQPVVRDRPPRHDAGLEHLPDDAPTWDNVDGVRIFPQASQWRVVAMGTPDQDADYGLYLYPMSQGVNHGFAEPLVAAHTEPGSTEIVISHARQAGLPIYDVGIKNFDESFGDVILDHRGEAGTVALGTEATRQLGEQQLVHVEEFVIEAAEAGSIMVEALVDPAGQPVHVAVLGPGFVEGSPADGLGQDPGDQWGRARVIVPDAAEGRHAVVVWRDAAAGVAPLDFELRILPSMADLAPFTLPGSHGPLVPTSQLDIAEGQPVPTPPMLYGDVWQTRFHGHFANLGDAVSEPFRLRVQFDGGPGYLLGSLYGQTAQGEPFTIYTEANDPTFVRAGRHTAGLWVDFEDTAEEWLETNNRHAEQWVWSPVPLELDEPDLRPAPPVRDGGWEFVPEGEVLFDNVDGVRTPDFAHGPQAGQWGAVAILPRQDADLDLRLHEPATSSKQGFDAILAESDGNGPTVEFALIDLAAHPVDAAWDVGVLRYAGESSYLVHAVQSQPIATGAPGAPVSHGPVQLGQYDVIHVLEFGTGDQPGEVPVEIMVDALAGEADVVAALYARDPASSYLPRSRFLVEADEGGGGEGETIAATLAGGQTYALVVAKHGHEDSDRSLEFEVHVSGGGVTPVPDTGELPARSRIETVFPNPFNPQTTVQFVMSRSGPAAVKVYDLQGRLVRTLADGHLEAGQHTLRWSGRDDRGQAVASGVYLLRAVHPDGEDRRRLTLVK